VKFEIYKMTPSLRKAGLALMTVLGSSSAALAAGDPSAAQTVFATHCAVTWNDANLDKFLADPVGFVHGTKMFVSLSSETDRQNVFAYLNTLKK
jgi:cytochrome c